MYKSNRNITKIMKSIMVCTLTAVMTITSINNAPLRAQAAGTTSEKTKTNSEQSTASKSESTSGQSATLFDEIPGSRIPTVEGDQIIVFFKNENGQVADEHRCKKGETVSPAKWIIEYAVGEKNDWSKDIKDKLIGWRSTLDGKLYQADEIPAVMCPVSYYAVFELTRPVEPSTSEVPTSSAVPAPSTAQPVIMPPTKIPSMPPTTDPYPNPGYPIEVPRDTTLNNIAPGETVDLKIEGIFLNDDSEKIVITVVSKNKDIKGEVVFGDDEALYQFDGKDAKRDSNGDYVIENVFELEDYSMCKKHFAKIIISTDCEDVENIKIYVKHKPTIMYI